jgi:hypothetical protein
MKKLAVILAFVACWAISISCGSPKFDYDDYDNSLTGSISYMFRADAEGIFDGVLFFPDDNSPAVHAFCSISKVSNNTVYFWCNLESLVENDEWKTSSIHIPELPITGEPYDVAFDYTSSEASVSHDETEYKPVNVTIQGWMRDTGTFLDYTRKSPIYPEFDCDITINCTIDGKELEMKISKLIAG